MTTSTLYQHGTLALMVPGLLAGTMTMKELLTHGDTGIGTGEGLDGELIILNGIAYQADSFGKVNKIGADFTTPFASVHFADFKPLAKIDKLLTQPELERLVLKQTRWANTFFAVLTTGTFVDVTTRAVAKSQKPFKTLAETADQQSIFHQDEVEGTMLSYYSPELFDGAAVGGFHHHFLSDAHDFGGHVLNANLKQGTIAGQKFATLEQHLPVNNAEYMSHDFSDDSIYDDIAHAEH